MALHKCCFCIDLRRGSLISGYVILIYNVGMLGLQITNLGKYSMAEGLALLVTLGYMIISFIQLLSSIVMLVGLHKNKPGAIFASLITTGTLITVEICISCSFMIKYAQHYDVYIWCHIGIEYVITFLYVYLLCVCGSYRRKLCNEGQTVAKISKSEYV